MTPKNEETFTVAYDGDGDPISKTIAQMTKPEMTAACNIAHREFEEALRLVEPYRPLIEAEVMLTDLDAALPMIEKCLRFEEVRLRVLRLGEAVMKAVAN
jgi:hypothetical protein